MLNPKLQLNQGIFHKDVELKATREGFGIGIIDAAKKHDNLIVLCADLNDSLQIEDFIKKFPKRFIQTGIAEQNMAGISAGLALSGKIPFACSFSVFNPGRNWEQIRLSICYSNANVKLVGSHSGLSHSQDGGMAQALEDIALTRTLPNMIVVHPLDYNEAIKATVEIAKHEGSAYLRLTREKTPVITTPKTLFKIGQANVLKNGTDITLLGTGPVTYEALTAAKDLKGKHKINAEVISVSTIKPLDEKTILNSAKKTGLVITIEDHQVAGGFGSAVAELLSEKHPVPVLRMGVKDKFGESGFYNELLDKYEMSGHHIVKKAIDLVKDNFKGIKNGKS